MAFAFELHFDEQTEAAIRSAWTSLAAQGCDTTRNGVAPHLTLAIASGFDEPSLGAGLRAFAAAHPPLTFTFGSVESFPGGVLYLAPIMTPALQAMHRDFHARLRPLPSARNSHYYTPGQWVPHCTLAMSMPAAGLVDGTLRLDPPLPPSGSLRRLRVVEYPALKIHFDCPLGR